jgi:hypothetical protein
MRTTRPALLCAAVLFAVTLSGNAASQSAVSTADVSTTLARAGARVEEFFTRAQSLICTETVTLQPLDSSFSAEGFSRTVQSELRVSWEPGLGGPVTEAQTVRNVLKVNGRPPREKDHRSCTTPEQSCRCCFPSSSSSTNSQQVVPPGWMGERR